jgi:hypothetical protein
MVRAHGKVKRKSPGGERIHSTFASGSVGILVDSTTSTVSQVRFHRADNCIATAQ